MHVSVCMCTHICTYVHAYICTHMLTHSYFKKANNFGLSFLCIIKSLTEVKVKLLEKCVIIVNHF